jgi:hypothetical protein
MARCLHRTWSVIQRGPIRKAECDRCGEEVDASADQWGDVPGTDEQISEAFLRSLPRPAQDELYANTVVRKLEAAGWQFNFSMSGNVVACSLTKGLHSFRSGPHRQRSAAIVAVAVDLGKSGQFRQG